MKLTDSIEKLNASRGRAVTIGKFDGIHLGHRALIERTVAQAESQNLTSCLVTFDRHPNVLLNPLSANRQLISSRQKAELVSRLEIEEMVELHFDDALASESAEDFVERVLVRGLGAEAVVVGHDFKFGKGQLGNVSMLEALGQKFGFTVQVLKPVLFNGQVVSSSRIKDMLESGDVSNAARLLGRFHSNRGMVEHGLKIGRKIGFPTANLSRDSEGYLPLDAVYAGWLHDGENRHPAALSVGINETIQAVPRLVEAHVLGRKDLDLYDKEVTIEYVEFIRPSLKFDGVDALIEAIN
ncbi:MAG: riboflavin biosynthesis protein RibF, partial [Actinomycetes bacterium]